MKKEALKTLLIFLFAVLLKNSYSQTIIEVDENTKIKVCFNITHTWVSDLGFYLIAPGYGQECGQITPGEYGLVELLPSVAAFEGNISNLPSTVFGCSDPNDIGINCNDGNDVENLCFSTIFPAGDPDYTACVCDMPTPLTGTYASAGPWNTIYGSVFNSSTINLNCQWKVLVTDCINADVGTINLVTLEVSNETDTLNLTTDPYYTYSVVDGICSLDIQAIDLIDISKPHLHIEASDTLCYEDNSGYISAIVTLGEEPYSYIWNTGDTSATITNLTAGTYSVIVTDANGITLTTNVTINQYPAMNLTISIDSVINYLDLKVTGGDAPFSYIWSTGETTQDINAIISGLYSVTVTDAYGCISTISIQADDLTYLCTDAATISQLPFSEYNYTCGYGNKIVNFNNACSSENTGGEDFTYKYIPADNQFINVNLEEFANMTTHISLMITKNCPSYGECVVSDSSGEDNHVDFNHILLEKNNEYYFTISSNAGCIYSFSFNIENEPATCFDGIQNNGEIGIDCGGPCGTCYVAAPIISPILFCSGGGYFSNNNATISISIGEPVTETISNTSAKLTQGFQQGEYNITIIQENRTKDISIILFPNPVKDILNIKITSSENEALIMQLFDGTGKILKNKSYSGIEIYDEILMSEYSIGLYYIRFISTNEDFLKTYKIEKIQN